MDVDACPDTAEFGRVKAMPTFKVDHLAQSLPLQHLPLAGVGMFSWEFTALYNLYPPPHFLFKIRCCQVYTGGKETASVLGAREADLKAMVAKHCA